MQKKDLDGSVLRYLDWRQESFSVCIRKAYIRKTQNKYRKTASENNGRYCVEYRGDEDGDSKDDVQFSPSNITGIPLQQSKYG